MGRKPRPDLSDRELLFLRYVAQGLTDKEIGRILALSHRTINNEMRRLYTKLGVHSRTGALGVAFQRGIFPSSKN